MKAIPRNSQTIDIPFPPLTRAPPYPTVHQLPRSASIRSFPGTARKGPRRFTNWRSGGRPITVRGDLSRQGGSQCPLAAPRDRNTQPLSGHPSHPDSAQSATYSSQLRNIKECWGGSTDRSHHEPGSASKSRRLDLLADRHRRGFDGNLLQIGKGCPALIELLDHTGGDVVIPAEHLQFSCRNSSRHTWMGAQMIQLD